MSDLTKTAKELFYALVNDANAALSAKPLADTNVSLSAPTSGTFGEKNTKVTITALADQGYSGTVDVTYNRLDIATLFSDASLTASIEGDSFTNASDLLTDLNSRYGLNLQASDIVEGDLSAQVYPGTYDLVMAAGSLAYTGTVTIDLPGVVSALPDVVTTTDLTGLTGPAGGLTDPDNQP